MGGFAVAIMGTAISLLVVVFPPSSVPRVADPAELIGEWRASDSGARIVLESGGRAAVSEFSFHSGHGASRSTVDASGDWTIDPAAPTAVGVLVTEASGEQAWIDLDYATCRGEPCLQYGPEEDATSFVREQ
ncbi:hypothetical protein GCM10022282_18700 [Agromyces indicus]